MCSRCLTHFLWRSHERVADLFRLCFAARIEVRQRTQNAPRTRKTMIVALAHKLLIALWRFVREGVAGPYQSVFERQPSTGRVIVCQGDDRNGAQRA